MNGPAASPASRAELRLEPVGPDNLDVALAIRGKPGDERFVSSVAESLEQAERFGGGWPQLIMDGNAVVGFVMGGFLGDEEPYKSGVWKLLIAAEHQGKGYGRWAVEAVADEARRRGHDTLGVFFTPGAEGPEGFWAKCGFARTDRPAGHEVHAARPL